LSLPQAPAPPSGAPGDDFGRAGSWDDGDFVEVPRGLGGAPAV